ncbi:MAG: rRNA maturation RNase YbeY [Minwuia sp.]|uniref:rRNA maturation RNase YbeY n=1 Tax=Minwuia sp. TaxID=2493630 RepID=UPI003A890ADA
MNASTAAAAGTLRLEVISDSGDWPDLSDLFERAAAAAWRRVGEGDAEASLALMDDASVRRLNREFRGKDSATDVLSFPADDSPVPGDDDNMLGDIALAFETVSRDSALENKSFEDHVAHLLVHGILHLMGYDHEHTEDAEEMEDIERSILSDLGIGDPYLDRSSRTQELNAHP